MKADGVALSRHDADNVLEALDFAITNVLEMSMDAIDYGNTEKMGREMETLHRLRMAQEKMQRATESQIAQAAE